MNMNSGTGNAVRKRMSPTAVCLLLLASALLSAAALNFGLFFIGALLMTVSAALLALLILMRSPVVCYLVCPVTAAFAAVLFGYFGHGITLLIIYVSFIAAGGVLAICAARKSSRTGTSLAVAATFVAFLFAAWLYVYLSAGNVFTPEALKTYILSSVDNLKAQLTEYIQTYVINYFKTTSYYGNAELSGSISEAQINESVSQAVDSFVYSLPGIAIAAIQIFGYICTCWFSLFVRAARCEILMPSPRWTIYPTTTTVIVFISSYFVYTVSYMIAMFTNTTSVVAVVSNNIVLATMSSMVAVGFSMIFGRRPSGAMRRRSPVGFIFLLAIILFVSPIFALSIMALVGSVGTLAKRKADSNNEKKDGEDDDPLK